MDKKKVKKNQIESEKKPMPHFVEGVKVDMVQAYDDAGKRLVVTRIKVDTDLAMSYLKTGDRVKVTGVSKGKGFTGVMKKWGFKGGPRTHGQSDRQRAPGSIGQSATPGRVFPGKKMPGRAGGRRVTVANLVVHEINEKKGWLKITGLIPGHRGSQVKIRKMKGKGSD